MRSSAVSPQKPRSPAFLFTPQRLGQVIQCSYSAQQKSRIIVHSYLMVSLKALSFLEITEDFMPLNHNAHNGAYGVHIE